MATYLETRFGKKAVAHRHHGAPVEASSFMPSRQEGITERADADAESANAEIRRKAMAEFMAQLKDVIDVDPADMQDILRAYDDDKGLRDRLQAGVRDMFSRAKDMDPAVFAERMASDADAVFQASKHGTEIPADNILIPILEAQGLLEKGKEDAASLKSLNKTRVGRRLSVGVIGQGKRIAGRAATPAAFAGNLALGVVDFSAAQQAGASALADHRLSEAVVKGGSIVGSALLNGLLLYRKTSVKGRPGYVVPWIAGVADLVWDKTTVGKISGAAFAASLAIVAPAMYGNVKRSSVDAAVTGEVGTALKAKAGKEMANIEAEIKRAHGLFGTLKPSLDAKMATAYKDGGEGWGPRTTAMSRVLFGKTKENDENYAAFLKDPKGPIPHPLTASDSGNVTTERPDGQSIASAEAAVRDAKAKLAEARKIKHTQERRTAMAAAEDMLSRATVALNALRKGHAAVEKPAGSTPAPDLAVLETQLAQVNKEFGLPPGAGAEQLLKKLADELNTIDTKSVFNLLRTILEDSDKLSQSGLGHQMLGPVASIPHILSAIENNLAERGLGLSSFTADVPWSDLAHSATGLRTMAEKEKGYTERRNKMAKALISVSVSAELTRYLKQVQQVTGVDGRMAIPSVQFDLNPDSKGFDWSPYDLMIKKTVWDHIEIPADDSPEWSYISRTFQQSGIPVDVTTPEGKHRAIAMLFGLIIGLLAGGVLMTIAGKKLDLRWAKDGPLLADEKRALYKTENDIVADMARLMRDREDSLFTKLAQQAGTDLNLVPRDQIPTEAVLQRRLRTFILSRMNPPMHETAAGQAFIDRKHHIGNVGLRQEYAKILNGFIDNYKEDRSRGLRAMLQELVPDRDKQLELMRGFVTESALSQSPDAVRANLAAWYGKVDAGFRADEIRSREANAQDHMARREALLGLRRPLHVELSKNTPRTSISAADIVFADELADIDAVIALQNAALATLSGGVIATPLVRDESIRYSAGQIEELAAELQRRELENKVGDGEATGLASQYSELAVGLGKRVGVLDAAIRNAFGNEARDARVRFGYAYDSKVPGLTITATLSREDAEDMTITFGSQVPNATLLSDESIIAAFEEKLRPESGEMLSMRYEAIHDAYGRETSRQRTEVISEIGTEKVAQTDLTGDIAADLNRLLLRGDIYRLQEMILPEVRAGEALGDVKSSIFEAPGRSSLGGTWNADIRSVLQKTADRNPGARVLYDIRSEEIIISTDLGEIRESVRAAAAQR